MGGAITKVTNKSKLEEGEGTESLVELPITGVQELLM